MTLADPVEASYARVLEGVGEVEGAIARQAAHSLTFARVHGVPPVRTYFHALRAALARLSVVVDAAIQEIDQIEAPPASKEN